MHSIFEVFLEEKRKFPVILDALSPFHLFLHSSGQIFTKGGPSTRDEYTLAKSGLTEMDVIQMKEFRKNALQLKRKELINGSESISWVERRTKSSDATYTSVYL